MKVLCACDQEWHEMTPTMLAMVVDAFQQGELQIVGYGISPLCLKKAFTEERTEEFVRKYPGRTVTPDYEESIYRG